MRRRRGRKSVARIAYAAAIVAPNAGSLHLVTFSHFRKERGGGWLVRHAHDGDGPDADARDVERVDQRDYAADE